jgi:hypothetical protein
MVRYNPTHSEPLDEEIVPLCDALNAAGFVTTSSCCGHGGDWPHVWFEHSSDERIENLARFILTSEAGDPHRRHFTMIQKEIRLEGYAWSLEIHLHDQYTATPPRDALAMARLALEALTAAVVAWSEREAASRLPVRATPNDLLAEARREAEEWRDYAGAQDEKLRDELGGEIRQMPRLPWERAAQAAAPEATQEVPRG